MKSRVVAAMAGIGLAIALAVSAGAQIRLDRPAGGGPLGNSGQQQQQPGGMITNISPQAVVAALQSVGFQRPEMLNLQGGLKGVKFDLNGTPVFVVLFGCQGDQCPSFTFYTFFGQQNVDNNFINGFNRDRRFGKLYVDKENSLTLAMDVHMIGGVGPQFVAGSGAVYSNAIKWLLEYKPE